jgi:hypothetical protein
MVDTEYFHAESSRRPAVGIALILSLTFVVIACQNGAPWFASVPALICAMMCVGALVSNRISGSALSGARLKLYAGSWQLELDIRTIDTVHAEDWTDGPPALKLVLRTGEHVKVPANCIGNCDKFLETCRAKGLQISYKS